METLNKFLKALQSMVKLDFKNKRVGAISKEQFSNESNSLLLQINTKENEFLFI